MKLKFIGCSDEQVSWSGCDDPRRLLKLGREYEVERRKVDHWVTRVYLKDYPGLGFNSVCFVTVKERRKNEPN